jgi:preprotein translocase subunit SecE
MADPQRTDKSAVLVLSASLIIAVVVWLMDVVFKAVMSSIYPN